jgi:GT2 family glycosyltransferase
MFVRGTALQEVGLLDLKGGEETEWHLRFRQRGWKTVFYHEAEVIHLKSMTVSTDPAAELINLRSFLNIYHKHEVPWRYQVFRLSCVAIYGLKYALARISQRHAIAEVARRGITLSYRWPKDSN